jgi:hypothetical protein
MPSNKRPEIIAVYFPAWHSYDHMSTWKGEGWCEWELVKAATPRFPGHYQPYQPTWGYFDESDPKWSEKEIALAAEHGIDVFLIDWYWYSGVRIMEEALERGLLKAKNREDIKFALMWANHDWADYFTPPFGQKWNSWLPMRHSPRDWDRVIDYCIEYYFRQPNYWKTGGNLFFSIYQPMQLLQGLGGIKAFRKILDSTNLRLARAKLPPLHLNAMVWNANHVNELKEAGYDSTTMYNITRGATVPEDLIVPYADAIEAHRQKWQKMAGTSLPHFPVVTTGWDVTPRCEKTAPWPFPPSPLTGKRDYPYGHVVVGNTPDLFEKLCAHGLEHCQATNPEPYAVLINAWNEWTEGCILLPEERYGTAFLEAVRKTFVSNASAAVKPA